MNRIIWTVSIGLALILAACGSTSTPPLPVPTEVTVVPNSGFVTSEGVVASARVVPAHETEMGFAISAPVKEVLVREGEVVSEGQTLITLYSPELELSVTMAESNVKAKELEYVYWVPRLDRPPERREQALAEVELSKARLETARATLAQTILLAPFDSTVVDIKVQAGELARPGQLVIKLGDLADMQIETTDLSERAVPHVQPGASVDIFVQALDRHVTGKVVRVSPMADTVGGDVVYPVIIDLDQQLEGLLWGMSAEVQIQSAP